MDFIYTPVDINDRHVGESFLCLNEFNYEVYGTVWLDNSSLRWYVMEGDAMVFVTKVLERVSLPTVEEAQDKAIKTTNSRSAFLMGYLYVINKINNIKEGD